MSWSKHTAFEGASGSRQLAQSVSMGWFRVGGISSARVWHLGSSKFISRQRPTILTIASVVLSVPLPSISYQAVSLPTYIGRYRLLIVVGTPTKLIENFRDIPQFLGTNFGTFTLIRSLPLRSTHTQIHSSLFLPPFTAAGLNRSRNTY